MDLTHAHERLVAEFAGIFSAETVSECLHDSALGLSRKPGSRPTSRSWQSGSRGNGSERRRRWKGA